MRVISVGGRSSDHDAALDASAFHEPTHYHPVGDRGLLDAMTGVYGSMASLQRKILAIVAGFRCWSSFRRHEATTRRRACFVGFS